MTGVKDESANNLAKLSSIDDQKPEVENHMALEHQKLTETNDIEIQRERSGLQSESSLTSGLKERQGAKPSV